MKKYIIEFKDDEIEVVNGIFKVAQKNLHKQPKGYMPQARQSVLFYLKVFSYLSFRKLNKIFVCFLL